ncbi:hypothetical protein PV05_03965 [Exophiala xenobiotica]|uniref:FAD/NAD(P)-binding domain-containing protein n=1 Tax=Exophiala xenobiotica TaxID=348802 RepID=A0A0D2DB94_9EURO|nr:uncharacterized protein PV05_03965 [Exophiala xenobiotica]KIW59522.1 hypothetical protein PV05_03965 [Exophiala xenobiotica]
MSLLFPKMLQKVFLFFKLIGLAISITWDTIGLKISARIHRFTYKSVPDPKNVVVVGGSFAGYFLARQLADSLPTGYRVMVIEKHSHYHFTWNFPRITVIQGHTKNAFIPYPQPTSVKPDGIYSFRQGEVIKIGAKEVILSDGSNIPFEYLAIATGSQARYPATMDADDKAGCMKFFEERQERIKAAHHIVVVGAGAAGVEVAGDIKTQYPQKKVTLVHSREQLLNNFGRGLHDIAKSALEELGVELYLGQRVISGLEDDNPTEVTIQSEKVLQCDALVNIPNMVERNLLTTSQIRCTGQYARSALVKDAFPSSVSPSGSVLVGQTLQITGAPPNVFACGDVIDLPGPRLGRAAAFQGIIVAQNIVRSISGRPLKTYKPGVVDTSIELTLGLGNNVTYVNDGGKEMSFPKKVPDLDMHAAQAWKMMGANPFDDPEDVQKDKGLVV